MFGNSFLDRFLENTKKQPDRLAVLDGVYSYSWKEVERLSGQVSAFVRDHSLPQGSFVSIRMPRGASHFICQLGILRSGFPFVSIDTDVIPFERSNYIIENSESKLVIDENIWNRVLEYRYEPGYSELITETSTAFALYTSGSTGTPKGALHEYGQLDRCAFSFEFIGENVIANEDSFAVLVPQSMAAAMIITIRAVYVGATVIIVPINIVRNPSLLSSFLENKEVSSLFVPPTILPFVQDVKSIRTIMIGGEGSTGIFLKDKQIFNVYGASEAISAVAMGPVRRNEQVSTLGVPNPMMGICIVDESGTEVPKGEIGELCFLNPYFKGYVKNEKPLDELFLSGKLYRSGDAAKILDNGELLVVGRKDDMFKVRGNRVEPTEIEIAFKKVSALESCVVRHFVLGNSTVIVLFYENPDRNVDRVVELEWRSKMDTLLPSYMVPSFFVAIKKFPCFDNGKINRRALACPDFSKLRPAFVAPVTEIEKIVCKAFENVLDVADVGLDDDFELLGGESITAMDLLVELSKFGIESKDISSGRTVRGIASILSAKKQIEKADDSVLTESRYYMLLPSQEHMFLQQLESDKSSPLWIDTFFDIPEKIDVNRFAKAVDAVLLAHPAFAFKIVKREGSFAQCYAPELLQSTSIENCLESEFEEKLKSFFDIKEILDSCLCFSKIYKTESKSIFAFAVNHSLIDGTSLGLFFNEVERVYHGYEISKDGYFEILAEYEAFRNSEEGRKVFTDGKAKEKESFASYSVTPKADSKQCWGASAKTMEISFPEFHYSPMEMYAFVYALAVREYNKNDKVAFIVTHHGKVSEKQKSTCGNFTFDLLVNLDFKGKSELGVFKDLKQQLRDALSVPFRPTLAPMAAVIYQSNILSMNVFGVNAVDFYVDSEFEIAENALNVHFFKDQGLVKMLLEYDSAMFVPESMEILKTLLLKAAEHLKNKLDVTSRHWGIL